MNCLEIPRKRICFAFIRGNCECQNVSAEMYIHIKLTLTKTDGHCAMRVTKWVPWIISSASSSSSANSVPMRTIHLWVQADIYPKQKPIDIIGKFIYADMVIPGTTKMTAVEKTKLPISQRGKLLKEFSDVSSHEDVENDTGNDDPCITKESKTIRQCANVTFENAEDSFNEINEKKKKKKRKLPSFLTGNGSKKPKENT